MTKTNANASALNSKKPAQDLIVLDFADAKPCGARFSDANPDLVAKAAELMDLKVYEVTSADLAAVAKKLPDGRLYANGRGFVPNIRQDLYTKVLGAIVHDPKHAATEADRANSDTRVPSGLPRSWDEIAPGHLVIAQETLEYGWWEAIVLARKGDMFTLRFRDFPQLPRFVRHRAAIALMSPPAE